ncbi:MAG: Uma2 family endonuclease [Chloroflexota bacterium]|nr:Uma2 family endonuclease [Chloroflexota bacterium]
MVMLHEAPAIEVGLSMEDFIAQFHEAPFELINDRRRLLMPTLPRHTLAVDFVYKLLNTLKERAGIIAFSETPFVLVDKRNWVKGSRVPDILVYERARFDAYCVEHPDWLDKPFILVPDLCIEVVSKNDQYSDVNEKVEAYLADGVLLVWVFDPQTRTVTVRIAGSTQATILYEDDTLDGGSVVRGFSVRIGEVFAGKV